MDNPLTPKKIQKLINLAEGRSYNNIERLLTEEDVNLMVSNVNAYKSPGKYESSSGILDLDHMEGFGESAMLANMSLSKSTAFNPGEMTGRSTGAESIAPKSALDVPKQQYGRHSIDLDSIISEMDKQTSEVNEIMRHSIATNTNYSFHSKRDLTADEASLIAREAPLPVMQTTQTYFQDSTLGNTSNVSVGAYFKNRCVDFGKILVKTDSPDRSMMPSITEVSASANFEYKESNVLKMDDMLDSVPVRQPRNTDLQNQVNPVKPIPLFKEPMKPKPVETTKPESRNFPDRPSQAVSLNPAAFAHKSFMTSSKPADVLLKKLHTSFKVATEDAEGSMENSLSISKIADYLGNQSNVSVTDMMQLNQKRPALKQPLTELHMNTHKPEIHVTRLIDSKKTETASSAGTVDTVISIDKLQIQEIVPKVVITQDNKLSEEDKHARSKSPSTKSPSTLSTVRDNYASFKSEDSPNSSNGEANRSKVPSPNIAYKELDKSVDWQEVLQQKRMRQRAGAKDHWVEIALQPVQGYVGVATLVAMSVTTLTDSWLTAKFQFDDVPSQQRDLNIELPRLPLLLSPGKSEQFTFYITSNVELDTFLPFTFYVKDACLDGEVQQKGELHVKFKAPVIQAMSSDGLNKLVFPAAAERTSFTKTLVLISDCPADLQIKLLVTEGDSMFSIRQAQEIKKSEVNKAILEREGFEDKVTKGKVRMSRQLCRLGSDSAIRVSITFDAPRFADLNIVNSIASFNGALQVSLIGGDTILRRVDIIGVVGVPELVIESNDSKIKVLKETTELIVSNTGRVRGSWSLMVQNTSQGFPFKLPTQFELAAGETKKLQMVYIGLEDGVVEMPIRYEENTTGKGTDVILTGGTEKADKPRSFPIKTNQTSLSWVRAGRKEVSLKNTTDKKVHVRCTIVGEGFSIDLPGGDSRGVFILSFNGCECRPLPIVFTPSSSLPQTASLHLVYDRHSEFSKKIPLYGCGAGEPLRWAGLVTFSATAALVRAAPRLPVNLTLQNKSTMPAFVAASVHFNLQYASVEPYCSLEGSRQVVGGRGAHSVALRVSWARVERAARTAATTALASVTVLSGAEATRRRILRIIRNESNGKLDVSLLPNHLKVLAEEFEGEDSTMDELFKDFKEPKTCLNELMGGLRELTAHIDLPQDFTEDHTIIISDDTVVEHHTMCD